MLKTAAIFAGIIVVGGIAIALSRPSIINQTIGMLSGNEIQERKITAQYENCYSLIRQASNTAIETTCYAKGETVISHTLPIAHFIFRKPAQLDSLTVSYPFYPTTVYQYGPNDFVVGLKDPVSEKKYPTTVWELPKK